LQAQEPIVFKLVNKIIVLTFIALAFFAVSLFAPTIVQAHVAMRETHSCDYFLSADFVKTGLDEQLEKPPQVPLGVFGKDDFLSELAAEDPEYAYQRLLKSGVLADAANLSKLANGKYVFALIELPHLGRREMRIGTKRFDPDENAHGHADLTWGFKVWVAGEVILEKVLLESGQILFNITFTTRSGTYQPETSRLSYAADWVLDTGLPIGHLELADYSQKTVLEFDSTTN
jgi:hypothetical protein